MPFRAHEHLFRTVPVVKKQRVSHYGPEEYSYYYESATRSNESFITYVGSAATSASSRYYKCELCHDSSGGDHGAIKTLTDLAQHCNERSHMSRVAEICALKAHPITTRCVELQLRADQLGCKAWQLDVCKKILMCSLYQASDETQANAERIHEAETTLEEYERLERISLLELAAWKAVCIVAENTAVVTTDTDHSSNKLKDYHAWHEWITHGWKRVKASHRKANEINVIVTSVLPFLDCANPSVSAVATTDNA